MLGTSDIRTVFFPVRRSLRIRIPLHILQIIPKGAVQIPERQLTRESRTMQILQSGLISLTE